MLAMRDPADKDPHDVLEITPDVVLVARAEHELSRLARDAKSRSGQQAEPPASPAKIEPTKIEPTKIEPAKIEPRRSPSSLRLGADDVPRVDTGFRAAATDRGPSIAQRIGRGLLGIALAICIGGGAIAWRSSGAVVTQTIAALAPNWASGWMAPRSSPAAEASAPVAPAAQDATAAAATPASQDAAAPAAAPDATATAAAPATPPADSTQTVQSMTHDLASLSDEVTQLKADIAGLKANQDQMSRDMAKVTEQNQRLKQSALQARAAMPPARKPPVRPTQAAAPAAYPAQASSYPPPAPYPPPQASAYPPSQAPYPPPSAYPPPPSAYPPSQTAYAPPPRSLQPPGDPDAPRPPMPVQ
jgi:chemotaxis protein histidine kinase CheA